MHVLARTEAVLERFPWVLPLLSFGSGLASFILVHRGSALASLIGVIVLAGWVWLLLQPLVRYRISSFGSERLSNTLVNFVTQSIQQETLFFSLPFLLLSFQSEDPGQLFFVAVVVLAALVSTLDPLYENYIARHYMVRMAFHGLCSFIAALIVLPTVLKIPVEQSFPLALGFIVLWLLLTLPVCCLRGTCKPPVLLLLAAVPFALWMFRSHLPAAGISVRQSVLATAVLEHEPVDALDAVSLEQLARGIYIHAAINAPNGLSQNIVFNWRHGRYSERIPSTIVGGRKEGYRTYSYKQNFIPDALGQWVVDILTPQGQLLDRVSFEVRED